MSLLGLLISLGLSFWEISISVNALVIAFEWFSRERSEMKPTLFKDLSSCL
jgi:hypothetical protein